MRIRKYAPGVIYEFDTIDELREFDITYVSDTRSAIIKKVAAEIGTAEDRIIHISSLRSSTTAAAGFAFDCGDDHYTYLYETDKLDKAIAD
ncbi:MAG: choline-phosphate cytidylyltransferase, partial [Mogibacterium sp.]|nr:choline-phosphate cytidylyltransferase [Mogibacterium sp.]